MSKTVAVPRKPQAKPPAEPSLPIDPVQSFVEAGEEQKASELRAAEEPQPEPVAPEEIVRTTLDLPKSVHRRMKFRCLQLDVTIADYLRNLIDKELPDKE